MSIPFVVYSSSTGIVDHTGECQTIDLSSQAQAGQSVLQMTQFAPPESVTVTLGTPDTYALNAFFAVSCGAVCSAVPGADGQPIPHSSWIPYTPVITPAAGAFTTLSLVSGSYIKSGPMIFFRVSFTITTVGTASGLVLFTLPSLQAALTSQVCMGYNTNFMLKAFLFTGSNNGVLSKYDGTSPIAAGVSIDIGGYYIDGP